MIEYTLLNVLMVELKIYYCPDKFYGPSKFGQYDGVKNRAPFTLWATQFSFTLSDENRKYSHMIDIHVILRAVRFNAHACMCMNMSTMSCLFTWRKCARICIYACRYRLDRRTQYTLCKLFFSRWLPRSKCCSSKTWFMCTLCACYLVDCSNGTMDNTAAVVLLYRRVTGSAPSNAPLKTLPMSSKSYNCVTFRSIKYLLSTFPLYTPHCNMILSIQKCCLLLTGVSTESQKHTSVPQTKRLI